MRLFLISACLVFSTAFGGEVYLNTIDSANSVVVERQEGPYIGLWLGAATDGSASFRSKLTGAKMESETGFAAGLKLGYYYRLPFAIRPSIEFELTYLNDDFGLSGTVDSRRSGRGSVSGGADIQTLIGTVNLVLALDLAAYRENVGDFWAAFHPYVGIGGGAAYSSLEGFDVRVKTRDGRKKLKVDGGSDFDFAYQLFTGLEFELDSDFSVFGEYKLIGINSTGSDAVRDYERDLWTIGCKFGY
jgi:opacity protein-like surface antigen